MSLTTGYAPDFRVLLGGHAVPTTLRASITTINATCGFGDADRLEIGLANEGLRWLDNDLFRIDTPVELWMGYSPEQPTRVFAGDVVGSEAAFPSSGMPTMTLVAQDRRTRLAGASPSRMFGVQIPHMGLLPIPDVIVAPTLGLEHGLLATIDPLGALLSAALGAVETVASINLDDSQLRQQIVRKQSGQTSLDLLKKIAAENAWEIAIDHEASPAGVMLTLMSPAGHIAPDTTVRYGRSLLEFTPRISTVGQVAKVTTNVWLPSIKLQLSISIGYDWDRQSLAVEVSPGFGMSTGAKTDVTLVDEPVSPANAARVVLSKLLPKLNKRLTARGSCAGNAQIRAGHVLRIEGVGETFGGLWRVTSVTQVLDSSGWRTNFDVRKEIWFGSIPAVDQGAVRVQGGLLTVPSGA